MSTDHTTDDQQQADDSAAKPASSTDATGSPHNRESDSGGAEGGEDTQTLTRADPATSDGPNAAESIG